MRLIVALAFVCAAGLASAQSPVLDRIKKEGLITLGYVDGAPPFSSRGGDGEPQGYTVDLCRAVSDGVRVQLSLPRLEVRWRQLTIQNRIEEVRAGRVDLECSTMTWTLSRQQHIDFSLITFIDGVTVVSKREAGLLNFADFAGRRIAVIEGTTTVAVLHDALRRRSVKAEVVTVASRAAGLKLLEDGAVHGLASDRMALIGSALATPGRSLYRLLDEDLSLEQYALAMPRGDHDFRLAVNRVLARLYRTGDIAEIYNRWLGPLGPPSVLLSAMYFVQSVAE